MSPFVDMASCAPIRVAGQTSLQSRVARSRSKASLDVPFAAFPASQRPPSYRGYGTLSMDKACEAVQAGKMSIRMAAEQYGVPKSTLHDKVAGKAPMNTKSGSKTYLTDEEEASLVEFLIGCASVGYAKSRREVLAIAQKIANAHNPGADIELTKGWWDRFRRRHPEVSLRQAEPLSYARAAANNPAVFEKYFHLLQDTIETNGLASRPGQIFNCDETGMPLCHKPPKVVAGVGQRHPYAVTSGDRSQITVLACASASGYTIPPMVIFDRKHLQIEMTLGEVPGTFYGLSESGWMNSELFQEWFQNHFLVHAPSSRPLLLLLDGHSSHYNVSTLRMAADESIILFCLPPHTTHLLQPLDNGAFSSLKQHWRQESQHFFARNPGSVITRRNFMGVFQQAWVKGMSMSNVIGCFRAAGIYPVNRQVVLSQLGMETTGSPTSPTPTPFVPFCTPRKDSGTATIVPASPQPPPDFSQAEVECFQARLKESTDSRYALWLETFHPQENARATARRGVLEAILRRPTPPAHRKPPRYQCSARVLTSADCIRQLQDKEEQKRLKQEEKEQKRLEREQRKKEKEAAKKTGTA